MPITDIRIANIADIGAIRDLTRAAYAKWVPLIGREPRPMTADYEAAILRDRFDLIYLDGVLVGLIQTVREDGQTLIENVAVAPTAQGQGVGRRLMAWAEDIARAAGHARIRLYTNQRFTPNIRLYQRLGYGIDREEEVGVGIIVHMSKRLLGGKV